MEDGKQGSKKRAEALEASGRERKGRMKGTREGET
jgi:hypothetical protein